MEDKNYRDDFELFLKESTDEFRMIPSRKVWYSIYNNMHPDRRWPSMTVCLLILAAVLYIGIENNNSLSSAARKNTAENFITNTTESNAEKNINFLQPSGNNSFKNKQQKLNIPLTATSNDIVEAEIFSIPQQKNVTVFNANTNTENQPANIFIKEYNNELAAFDNSKTKLSSNSKLKIINKNGVAEEDEISNNIVSINEQPETFTVKQTEDIKPNNIIISATQNDKDKLLKNLLITEKSWKEDYAFRNKPAINKLKQNGSMSYYITPSLGYRVFKKREPSKIPNSPNSFSGRSLFGDRKLDDNAALSLEFGASFQYAVSKNVRVKTGVQANYSNYTSNVTALGHPSQITVDVSNYASRQSGTNYASASGNDELNRSTIQLSIPIGADIKIAGEGNFKWYVGGTLQPTYLLKGSGYVLSSDGAHYASEPTLLRKLNLNSSIETFISFKTSAGITVNVGPQFRYQLFSTYKNEYNYSEKLYNLGIKLGVSTTF